jgi:putative membrane protein insertion efficiency factor
MRRAPPIHDPSEAPRRRRPAELPRAALIGVVLGYRAVLKPWLGNACRFEPTCSQYALDALRLHGAARGTLLAAGRLLRCHPWCAGGCDPVPPPRRPHVAAPDDPTR